LGYFSILLTRAKQDRQIWRKQLAVSSNNDNTNKTLIFRRRNMESNSRASALEMNEKEKGNGPSEKRAFNLFMKF